MRTRHRSLGWGLAATLALLIARPLRADAPKSGVLLKDGTRVEGTVVSITPGKEVVVELADKSRKTIAWSEIGEVDLDPAPTAVPTTTPPPPTYKPKPKTTDTEHANVDFDPNNPNATYHSEKDCAESADEHCKATTDASISKGGLAVGFSEESATDVTTTKTSATTFEVSASFVAGKGDNISLVGGNAAVGVRRLSGGVFPGRVGGSWFGWYLEGTAAGGYTKIKISTPEQCFSLGPGGGQTCVGGDTSSSAGLFLGTLGAGIQWMHFGAIDPTTKKQGGFGLALGGVVGYQKVFSEGGSGSTTYGPQLSFVFPSYNPGTATYSSTQLNIFILPTKDFVFFIAGFQAGFG